MFSARLVHMPFIEVVAAMDFSSNARGPLAAGPLESDNFAAIEDAAQAAPGCKSSTSLQHRNLQWVGMEGFSLVSSRASILLPPAFPSDDVHLHLAHRESREPGFGIPDASALR
jgi:hypothetical protein